MPPLERLDAADVAGQLTIFGWAVTGGDPDVAAQHAERQGEDWGLLRYAWDHGQSWLARTQLVEYGQDPRPFRAWAALPWVVEHYARNPSEHWPGL